MFHLSIDLWKSLGIRFSPTFGGFAPTLRIKVFAAVLLLAILFWCALGYAVFSWLDE